jgi:hypothetical protein
VSGKRKNGDSTSKFKNLYFPGSKNLLEQDQTTKNTVEQQKLKKLLRIAPRNSNKTTVFKASKNFMAQDKHHQIEKKYLNSPFEI